ncbi:MAG: DUF2161 family putative PD-(D/E)XK-type phosphodiesterase [Bacillota bacterium]|nr:DUF2161 family putative PD-(D/E)XK-type phosphodiesterase [Bacillota bacterium]
MSARESRKETDLYPYIKQWLLDRSCVVQAEVKDIDVAALYRAEGDEELFIAVELKTRVSLELLLQAVDRLDVADLVYIAVPWSGNEERIEQVKKLCRRLGIGMLAVNLRSVAPVAEELVAPKNNGIRLTEGEALPPDAASTLRTHRSKGNTRASKLRNAAIREFLKRKSDVNIGGSRGTKLMTAYREESLYLLHLLDQGAETTKQIKTCGIKGSGRILSANYYGWFTMRTKDGTKHYGISPQGRQALADYADIVEYLVREHTKLSEG